VLPEPILLTLAWRLDGRGAMETLLENRETMRFGVSILMIAVLGVSCRRVGQSPADDAIGEFYELDSKDGRFRVTLPRGGHLLPEETSVFASDFGPLTLHTTVASTGDVAYSVQWTDLPPDLLASQAPDVILADGEEAAIASSDVTVESRQKGGDFGRPWRSIVFHRTLACRGRAPRRRYSADAFSSCSSPPPIALRSRTKGHSDFWGDSQHGDRLRFRGGAASDSLTTVAAPAGVRLSDAVRRSP